MLIGRAEIEALFGVPNFVFVNEIVERRRLHDLRRKSPAKRIEAIGHRLDLAERVRRIGVAAIGNDLVERCLGYGDVVKAVPGRAVREAAGSYRRR